MESNGVVLDTSAFVAFVRREPTADEIALILQMNDVILMSASSRLECCMVLASLGGFTENDMVRAERDLGISIVPFSSEHASVALEAFKKFGKGRHKAGLNFGDCQAYATAKLAGLPLVHTGNDFSLTDLETISLVTH